ncbi:hypothetical protein Plec18167_008712 [Paecilomyces lecythidis]|uniref:Uncharacterized protein n=1 Tax=Paecilomyces lecythidis TaxID=3004212 RepID=A0ABR3WVT8_9EURO
MSCHDYTVTVTADGKTETYLYDPNTRSLVGDNMTPSDCERCTLFQYLVHWCLHKGPFWVFLAIIVVWAVEVKKSLESKAGDRPEERYTKWLIPHIKTRGQLTKAIVLHMLFLPVLLVEGYWILQSWWGWMRGYWTWELKYFEWFKQLHQFVMEAVLALLFLVLLAMGIALVIFWIGCLLEFLDWKFDEPVEQSQSSQPSKPSTEKADLTE